MQQNIVAYTIRSSKTGLNVSQRTESHLPLVKILMQNVRNKFNNFFSKTVYLAPSFISFPFLNLD